MQLNILTKYAQSMRINQALTLLKTIEENCNMEVSNPD